MSSIELPHSEEFHIFIKKTGSIKDTMTQRIMHKIINTSYVLFCALYALFYCSPIFANDLSPRTISTAPLVTPSDSKSPLITEAIVLTLSDDTNMEKWTFAFKSITTEGSVFEWVPEGEKIENWSELLQIQYLPFSFARRSCTADTLASLIIDDMKSHYPGVVTEVLQASPESALYEWKVLQKTNAVRRWELPLMLHILDAQVEIARLITTKKGIHRIAYTKKASELDPHLREEWIKALKTAHIEIIE